MEKNVQIYGTLGPACSKQETLEQMFAAGLTGMRLNLSHTSLPESAELIEHFRQAAVNMGVIPQLLIDMQGPELRVGNLKKNIPLTEGEQVTLIPGEEGDGIPVPAVVLENMETGDEILLNDGKIALEVCRKTKTCGICHVVRGGRISSHKSIKIVGKQVELPVLTTHDVENLRLAKEYGVTGLMQPFVRSGSELSQVRRVLRENKAEQVQIFAKIESRGALERLDEIIGEADVIIIARGDLGNDMELWELPAVQKEIEAACRKAGKPFVVVTQMLASMEENPVPTRAEVSDIFNAVADGAYGVMVTGESAVGKYPVEVIKYLANTARAASSWIDKKTLF